MAHSQVNGYASLSNASDEDFELMGDLPKEDPIIVEVISFKRQYASVLFFLTWWSSSVVVHVTMKSRRNLDHTFWKGIAC